MSAEDSSYAQPNDESPLLLINISSSASSSFSYVF